MKANARENLDYWVTEEETGDEGFVSLYIDDEFWVLNGKGGYSRRKVFHRKFKQGKEKGCGGKQSKRPGFRPRSQKKGKGAIPQKINNTQMTKRFMERKERKVARKEERRTRTLSRAPRKASHPRTTHHPQVERLI